MIGRRENRAICLMAGLLTFAMVAAGFVTHPLPAAAAAMNVQAQHVVLFQSLGTQTQHVTASQTVGDFLRERGITPGPQDYVHPAPATPLADNLIIEYAPAVPVKLVTGSVVKTVVTTADDVGALLEEQGVQLDKHDVVRPSLADPIVANATIRISRIVQWSTSEKRHIAQHTIRRIDFNLPPGASRVVRAGRPGLTLTMVDYTQTDGKLDKHVVARRLLRKPQARIIAEGVGTYAAIADFARYGLQRTSYIASTALDMVATAYTARCSGCSGYTAIGFRAGHGIVAVDPRVIPLGSRLFIPGYGFAIAGDTGGAIVGRRIDLGFDSLDDALSFGRRPVKVYTLH